MSVVGEFTVPTSGFTLEHALTTVPEMTVEAERSASHSSEEVMPFLWARGADFGQFKQAVDDDPTVTEVAVAEETGDEMLYRLKWADEFCDLINDMIDHHANILEAKARADQWHLRLRFAQEEMLSDFQSHFREQDRQFELHRLGRPSEPRQRVFGLTDDQYEALTAAVKAGYFSVPRNVSVGELGHELDISANAASERIRRGCNAMIRSGLMITEDTE